MERPRGFFIQATMRYWGGAMSLVDDEDADKKGKKRGWPGFRYTAEEWSDLMRLGEPCTGGEIALILLLNAVFYILIAGALVCFVLYPILKGLYPDLRNLNATVYFGLMGMLGVIMYSIGFPVCMALTGAIVGRWYKVWEQESPVPAERVTALYRKLLGQLVRTGVLASAGCVVAAWVLSMTGGQGQQVLLVGMRILAGLWSAIMLLYFVGRLAAR